MGIPMHKNRREDDGSWRKLVREGGEEAGWPALVRRGGATNSGRSLMMRSAP